MKSDFLSENGERKSRSGAHLGQKDKKFRACVHWCGTSFARTCRDTSKSVAVGLVLAILAKHMGKGNECCSSENGSLPDFAIFRLFHFACGHSPISCFLAG